MFAEALKTVSQFTHPVVISQRFFDGTVSCGMATFIILNEEGWILTSAHVLGALHSHKAHSKEIDSYEKTKAEIESNSKLNYKQKKKKLKKMVTKNNKWITYVSYWWGKDGNTINNFHFNNFRDITLGKIEPFDKNWISTYPTFKNPKSELLVGSSLCRLGFPFHQINATFEEKTKKFSLEPGALPMPRFPIEGIHTRVAIMINGTTKEQAKFIETSSPGLRGQSGGPIFDVDGNIWGLQSRTTHLPLGFSPKVKSGKKEVEEHQFLSVGLGTHVEDIINFLTENKINFNLEPNP